MAIYTAKVKITDLAEQLYNLVSAEDVLPIVDITGDASKKITVANLQLWLEQNGLATNTELTAEETRALDAEAVLQGLIDALQVEINNLTGVDTGYGDRLTQIEADILQIQSDINDIEAGTGDITVDGGTY
tara:strand:- start:85 stop:477 length:393 start_codon:yes stop_codon:yes gene_type:complete